MMDVYAVIKALPRRAWTLLAVCVLAPLLRARSLPSREELLPADEERVVLLGASSGVGRDLAHAYSKRRAKICLVARRLEALNDVKAECISFGLGEDRILVLAADVTNVDAVIEVRDTVTGTWGGLDTLHILAGVPSTTTLHDRSGVSLSSLPTSISVQNPLQKRHFTVDDETFGDQLLRGRRDGMPSKEGLEKVAVDARACAEVNYVGTVLALSCFLPLLASTSRSPVLHHLSSAAATVPTPRRTLYAATKAAALLAVESCRVECEGCGVRFFSLCPGTIANGFRLKTSTEGSGGYDELESDIRHDYESLLLQPEKVVETILEHLALNPAPQPLVPFWPFSAIPLLRVPPKHLVHLPWLYRVAAMVRDTPLGWLWIEPAARRKYGIPGRS